MDLEQFLEVLLTNPQNIKIEYSNIDGKETLIVNGKEITEKEEYNDTEILNKIATFKSNIELLDENIYVEVLEDAQDINFKHLDTLINQEHFSKEEANIVSQQIDKIYELIRQKITSKVYELAELLEKF